MTISFESIKQTNKIHCDWIKKSWDLFIRLPIYSLQRHHCVCVTLPNLVSFHQQKKTQIEYIKSFILPSSLSWWWLYSCWRPRPNSFFSLSLSHYFFSHFTHRHHLSCHPSSNNNSEWVLLLRFQVFFFLISCSLYIYGIHLSLSVLIILPSYFFFLHSTTQHNSSN